MGGAVAHIGERTDIYRVFVGKPEGKRPLARPRLRKLDVGYGLDQAGSG